jgi:hypothetical protein
MSNCAGTAYAGLSPASIDIASIERTIAVRALITVLFILLLPSPLSAIVTAGLQDLSITELSSMQVGKEE